MTDPAKSRTRGLRRGNPGNRGGRRQPVAFIEACDRLAYDDLLPRLAEKLRTGQPDDPAYRWAADLVVKYSQKLPAQMTEQTGELTIRIVRGAAR